MRTSKSIVKQRLLSLLMLFAMLGSVFSSIPGITAFAAQIDTNATVSLTLDYHLDGVTEPALPASGVTFKLYRVADISPDAQFMLSGDFANYPWDLSNISTNKDWLDLATTISGYVKSDNINYLVDGTTGDDGTLTFSDLNTGLYLIIGDQLEWKSNGKIYTPTPVLISLPNQDAYGEWQYNVTTKIKFDGDNPPPGPTPTPTPTPGPNDPTDPPGPNDPTPTPGPHNPTPTPGPHNPTPTPGPHNPTPTPGPNDPTDPPGPNDPTPTPGPNDPTDPPGPNDPTPTPGPNDPTSRPTQPVPTQKPSRPSSKTSRTAEKVWDDDDNEHLARPAAIVVQLLRNGEVYDTATLDASNNWKHIWTGLSNGYDWAIVESDVPEGYTVLISRNATIFTITNTYHGDHDNNPNGTEPPATQDPSVPTEDPSAPTQEPGGDNPGPDDPSNDPNNPNTPGDTTPSDGDTNTPGDPSFVEQNPDEPFIDNPNIDNPDIPRYQQGSSENPTPKTGDENMIFLWLGLAVLFAAIALWAIYNARDRREQR